MLKQHRGFATSQGLQQPRKMFSRLVCINDYEQHAKSVLQKSIYDYYKSGANDQETLADNIAAFSR